MTIEFVTGSIFDQDCEALVDPVNCVGVAGKGLALEFKRRFRGLDSQYVGLCARGEMRPGWIRVADVEGKKIILFPTKQHWREPSRMWMIQDGLVNLAALVRSLGIRSIAIPALGCGCGGLSWRDVKLLIVAAMEQVPECRTIVVEP